MVEFFFFFFKQKTAYEMRISDWSSDVCSSDLRLYHRGFPQAHRTQHGPRHPPRAGGGGDAQPYAADHRRDHGRDGRSEELRVGKEWSVRVDLGGRRIIKIKTT